MNMKPAQTFSYMPNSEYFFTKKPMVLSAVHLRVYQHYEGAAEGIDEARQYGGAGCGQYHPEQLLEPLELQRRRIVKIPLVYGHYAGYGGKRVDQKEPYTMRNMDAALKVGANSRAKGERSMEGITLKA